MSSARASILEGLSESRNNPINEGNITSILKELNSLPTFRGVSKVKYDDIVAYEEVLRKFPVGTKLKHKIDAGWEDFEKTEGGSYGWWKHHDAPWGNYKNESEFDIARWFAGRAVISRGDIELG